MIIPASRGIARIPHLSAFLEGGGDCVVGWGLKPSGIKARALAERRGLRCLLLEDGFLRSLGRNDPPISLIIDDVGIYYDASAPSRVEQHIARPITAEETERAGSLINAWRRAGVSKYNHAPDYAGALPERYVLVVDQTFGDAAIRRGQADEKSFTRMFQAALDENPDAAVLVKVHPDMFTHGKAGYFMADRLSGHPRVHVVAEECHAARLLREAEAVYTVTSQMGFEALLWGKPVRCFGMPFYGGWGLTHDDLARPERRHPVAIQQLTYGALIAAPRYVGPSTGERWTPEQALSFMEEGRKALNAHWESQGFRPSEPGLSQRLMRRLGWRRVRG